MIPYIRTVAYLFTAMGFAGLAITLDWKPRKRAIMHMILCAFFTVLSVVAFTRGLGNKELSDTIVEVIATPIVIAAAISIWVNIILIARQAHGITQGE